MTFSQLETMVIIILCSESHTKCKGYNLGPLIH